MSRADFSPESIASLAHEVLPVIREHLPPTPVVHSAWLSELSGGEVFLKCENLQRTGSFKIRGVLAALSSLSSAAKKEGVLSCSTGNHGSALAWASQLLGIPCKIVVPQTVAANKVQKIKACGSELITAPFAGYDRSQAWTLENLEKLGGTYVSPFEDPHVIAGNGGTLALELLDQEPKADLWIVPCGGGGMICGVGSVLKTRGESTELMGVNSVASAGMFLSRRDGKPYLVLDSDPTLADGTEGGIGVSTFALGNQVIDDCVCVSEGTIAEAVRETMAKEKLVVEGAAALSVAAVLEGYGKGKRVGLILSGGNIDEKTLVKILTLDS
ncbi:MAG: pyridoxal-phosphate dependent enzyme [Candidatus Eisenbacteria bacterium]|uniref:Pyridoxal-phosphate dependent enzyme n=1 Tax=Eiseniibacteriota bacterium TaxID=2212470 RepID=A0A7Y2EEL4_UNCEI|nr:pyridoxal-phosphate dependent enzyme [Candidatus Eisenbacteria bacterium]